MFSKEDIELLREALDYKLKSIRRLAVSQPLFKPVADAQEAVYTGLSLRLEKLNEASTSVKK